MYMEKFLKWNNLSFNYSSILIKYQLCTRQFHYGGLLCIEGDNIQ